MLGQGEGEKKRLVLAADGALEQKLLTYERVMGIWAQAYAKRQVPAYYIDSGGKGNTDTQSTQFMNTLNVLMADKLGLDLSIPRK